MTDFSETLEIANGQVETTAPAYRVAESSATAEKHVGLTGCAPQTHPVITVRKCGTAPYLYIARKARLLTRWITVKADSLFRTVFSRVSRMFQNVFRISGIEVLRKSAILRI